MTSSSRRLAWLAAGMTACSAAHDRGGEPVPDGPLPGPTCSADLPAGAPRPIAENVAAGSVTVGACGHLAYADGARVIHLLDAQYARELERAAHVTSPAFSPDGALFIAHGPRDVLLRDLRADRSERFLAQAAGFLLRDDSWSDAASDAAESALFVCDDAGFGVVVDGAVETRFPGEACNVVATATHGSRVVARRGDALVALDFARGDARTLAIAELGSDDQRSPREVHYLSEDGRLLLRQVDWYEPCGDTECWSSTTDAVAFDLASGGSASLAPGFSDVLEGEPGSRRLVTGNGRSLAAVDARAELSVAEHAGFEPLTVMPGHGDVLARRLPDEFARGDGLVLIAFGRDGKVTEVSPSTYPSSTPWQPWFAVSRAGNVVGHQRFDDAKCVRYPDDDLCHTQLWAFDVWTRAAGRLQTVYSTQPVRAAWVGADGSVLLEGPVVLGPIPEHAAPGEVGAGSGAFLVGPDGTLRAHWEGSVAQAVEGRGSLFVVITSTGAASLERVDLAAGTTTQIDRAVSNVPEGVNTYPTIALWLDAAGDRLVYLKSWDEGAERTPRNSLHAGRAR